MPEKTWQAVTGAFGYSGKYIAHALLETGQRVITLTNSLHRPNPFGDRVRAYPLNFHNPAKLAESLDSVAVLYNTYWVRFNYRTFTYSQAVDNSDILFSAAKEAGVRRIVHISITNPAENSPFEYFRGKARVERLLIETGISYAILRPAVLFGKKGILINNIAWALRRFPVFGVFGAGNYRLQPIYVGDLAEIAVEEGGRRRNTIINAIGPETFTYRGLVKTIGMGIGKPRPIVSVPPLLGCLIGLLIGRIHGDVMITREEIGALMAGLLSVDSPPAGKTRLTEWITAKAGILGKHYASELARRKR